MDSNNGIVVIIRCIIDWEGKPLIRESNQRASHTLNDIISHPTPGCITHTIILVYAMSWWVLHQRKCSRATVCAHVGLAGILHTGISFITQAYPTEMQ